MDDLVVMKMLHSSTEDPKERPEFHLLVFEVTIPSLLHCHRQVSPLSVLHDNVKVVCRQKRLVVSHNVFVIEFPQQLDLLKGLNLFLLGKICYVDLF